MFRKGCCVPGGSFMPQGVASVETAYDIMKGGHDTAKSHGYDFAEATVGLIMKLSEEELARAVENRLTFEVANSFIPPTLPICETMKNAPEKLESYVDEAMRRMKLLGCGMVIFGSGAARRIPEAMDRAEAEEYLDNFLRLCNKMAEKHDVTVALEPLNRDETNYMTSVAEGYAIAKRLALPRVRLLADAYHMAKEGESTDVLAKVQDILVHVHISEPDRSYPGKSASGGDYLRAFSAALAATSYRARVSVECTFSDFVTDSGAAFAFVNKEF
ncbi:MAG: sugar phosphate isomerase/epimerase [Ruminococcaceae bacterium]|nr:sugar phosphate isomerase/epimerase [Oscillospiraceae bacterium]